jgi:Zn-dependent oligopeptidase
MQKGIIISLSIVFVSLISMVMYMNNTKDKFNYDFFVSSKNDVEKIKNIAINEANIFKKKLLDSDSLSFKNTFYVYDLIDGLLCKYKAILDLYLLVGNDSEIKSYIQSVMQEIVVWSCKNIIFDYAIYQKLLNASSWIKNNENLNPTELMLINDVIRDLKKEGAHLSQEQKNRLTSINKEIEENASAMEINIQQDKRFILATKEDLAGVNESFINTLVKNSEGLYCVTIDYPTTIQILDHCTVRETRKRYHYQRSLKGYPANTEVLAKLQKLCHEKAQLIGYENYAEYTYDDEMANNSKTVSQFLTDIELVSRPQAEKEKRQVLDYVKEYMPVYIDNIEAYDGSFIFSSYEKHSFNVNNHKIAEYFPAQQTIDRLLNLYSTFFGIIFKKHSVGNESWAWDKHLDLLEVYDNNNKKLGNIILDIHPRPGKYGHACKIGILHGVKDYQEPLCAVICNFSQPTFEHDALLHFTEVNTFFHEFGHALHHTFGITQFFSHSGTNTSRDFVEIPSQLFEQWLLDKNILKMVSGHYKTGESLPDEDIASIQQSEKFGNGLQMQRQTALSRMSFDVYTNSSMPAEIAKLQAFNNIISLTKIPSYDHFECSFGHLAGYFASYYSYQWSLVRALDIFDYIKEVDGLLDEKIGKRLRSCILAKGSSEEYVDMIENFLGRPLSLNAFEKHITQ